MSTNYMNESEYLETLCILALSLLYYNPINQFGFPTNNCILYLNAPLEGL